MRLTVRGQLIIFATLITCFVVTGIIVYTLYFGKISKLSDYMSNSSHTHQVLGSSIVNSLYFSDLKSLKVSLNNALFNPNIMCTVVYDASFSRIVQASQPGFTDCPDKISQLNIQFQVDKPSMIHNDDGLFIGQKITMPDHELVGYLFVGFTLEHIVQSINKDVTAYLLLAAVSLLIALLCAYQFSLYFSQPLTHMVQVSQDIGRGKLNSKILATRNDEIGQLSYAINTMAENLKKVTVSKDYLDTVIHSLGEMLFVIDSNLVIRQVNYQVTNVLGYSESELYSKSFTSIFVSADSVILPEGGLSELLESGVIEVTLYNHLGLAVPVLLSTSSFYSDEGESHGYVCIARDITERKQVEKKLSLYNSKLASTNQALKIAQDQLVHSAKMASIGEITAGLAHEINQPLGAIQLNAEFIHTIACEEGVVGKEDLVPIYNKIHRQINRIKKIVQHLRIFSRDDKIDDFEETDMLSLIDDSLVLFSERFRLKKIQLVKEFATDLPPIECNKIHIEQVLTNLLSNAEHALSMETKKVIKLRVYADHGYLVIEVEDNGHGIAQEHLSKIFDPFFTTKEVGEGTGLGMSISYGIVQSHKGKLTVNSQLSKNTIFTLSLPIKQNHQIKVDEVTS